MSSSICPLFIYLINKKFFFNTISKQFTQTSIPLIFLILNIYRQPYIETAAVIYFFLSAAQDFPLHCRQNHSPVFGRKITPRHSDEIVAAYEGEKQHARNQTTAPRKRSCGFAFIIIYRLYLRILKLLSVTIY